MNQDVTGEPLLPQPDIEAPTASAGAPEAPLTYCDYLAKVLSDPDNTEHDLHLLLRHGAACRRCGDLIADYYGPATDEATRGTA